jgi:predicted AAA+ superfamily ATPase
LSTYLTWRYIEFNIYSLSFNEFSQFKDEKKSKQLFLEYLKLGWMPAIFKMNYSEEIIYPYLSGVYNTIIIKDILSHYTIKNIVFFKDLYKYTISNIWNVISGATIKAYLRSQKISLWNDTVLNYLQYAQDVFLLNRVKSINPHTKKYFEIYNKYYVSDLWLRNSIVGFDFSRDIWQLLENYVFLELKRSWYDVIIGRFANGKEVDFIATKLWITKYFQVSYLLWSEETILREYSSLQQIHDNWDKYVVSMDEIDIPPSWGIKHVNILDLETVL